MRELGHELERLEVLEQLLGLRRAEDDRRRVRVPRDPRKCELRRRAPQLWSARVSQRRRARSARDAQNRMCVGGMN